MFLVHTSVDCMLVFRPNYFENGSYLYKKMVAVPVGHNSQIRSIVRWCVGCALQVVGTRTTQVSARGAQVARPVRRGVWRKMCSMSLKVGIPKSWWPPQQACTSSFRQMCPTQNYVYRWLQNLVHRRKVTCLCYTEYITESVRGIARFHSIIAFSSPGYYYTYTEITPFTLQIFHQSVKAALPHVALLCNQCPGALRQARAQNGKGAYGHSFTSCQKSRCK